MSPVLVEVLRPEQLTEKDVVELNILLQEFSPESSELSLDYVREIAENECLIVARDGDVTSPIVGMATLVTYRRPTGRVGRVEDVIVLKSVRGRGIGREIMSLLIRISQEDGCKKLNLTSRESRVAAHSLYRSLGFKEKETHVFQLML